MREYALSTSAGIEVEAAVRAYLHPAYCPELCHVPEQEAKRPATRIWQDQHGGSPLAINQRLDRRGGFGAHEEQQ
jgi:hypothetical protein